MSSGVIPEGRRRRRARGNRLRRERVAGEPRLARKLAGNIAALAKRALVAATPMLVSAAIVLVMGGVGYGAFVWLTTADRFAIDAIDIAGTERIERDEVLAALGIAAGDNIFMIDTGSATARVGELPWVASASVRRELPDRLAIEITEHEPAAIVDLGKLYLVDDQGHAFKRLDIASDEGADLVVITGITRERYTEHPEVARAAIVRALATRTAWDGADRPRLGEIHVDPTRGLTLFTYDRALEIFVGNAAPTEMAGHIALYDRAWAALSSDEQRRAKAVRIAPTEGGGRVVLSFSESRTPN